MNWIIWPIKKKLSPQVAGVRTQTNARKRRALRIAEPPQRLGESTRTDVARRTARRRDPGPQARHDTHNPSKLWPNITLKKNPPPTPKECERAPDKAQYFSPNPGDGT